MYIYKMLTQNYFNNFGLTKKRSYSLHLSHNGYKHRIYECKFCGKCTYCGRCEFKYNTYLCNTDKCIAQKEKLKNELNKFFIYDIADIIESYL